MNRKIMRIGAVLLGLGALSGCGAMQETQIFQSGFWSQKADENTYAEVGLSELAKGNNVEAQSQFQKALNADPGDVYALYGMAVLYQNTGQPTRARQLYEQILSLNPQPNAEILVWAGTQTQPIVDLAQINLARIENGMTAMPGAANASGGNVAGGNGANAQGGRSAPQAMPQSQLYVQPNPLASGQGVQGQMGTQMGTGQAGVQADMPMFSEADKNIVERFKALRALLDQGLITQEEFLQRRQANLGSLLPLTAKPPATGLDRPVPSVDQISGRLRAIGRALEMRAISPAQHMAERSMILDALMPSNPASMVKRPAPPQGLMQAADAVRRLEMLKEDDLITSDEYAKERNAIEAAMQARPMESSPSGVSSQPMNMSNGSGQNQNGQSGGQGSGLSGFQPAVHLASYRREQDALKGWAELNARNGALLSNLQPHIERVNLGGSKGVFFRLKAGPLPSNGAAENLCRQLKAQRQYCEPTTVNLG